MYLCHGVCVFMHLHVVCVCMCARVYPCTNACNLCQSVFSVCVSVRGDVVEAHAMALNCTVTFLSIHVAKIDFSETFQPRGSSSVTNN